MKFSVILLLLFVTTGDAFLKSWSSKPQTNTPRSLFGFGKKTEEPNPSGWLGNLGNFGEMMKKAQEATKLLESTKDELGKLVHTASDSSNRVSASFSGIGAPTDITISESILSEGAASVSLAVKEAVSKAYELSKNSVMERMSGMLGDLGIPADAKGALPF